MNWVLVPLRTQTYYPWDFWRRPYIVDQPSVRLHEVLYAAKERMEQAAEGLRKASSINPSSAQYYYVLAEAYRKLGKPKRKPGSTRYVSGAETRVRST